jgi:hypothetical protein
MERKYSSVIKLGEIKCKTLESLERLLTVPARPMTVVSIVGHLVKKIPNSKGREQPLALLPDHMRVIELNTDI